MALQSQLWGCAREPRKWSSCICWCCKSWVWLDEGRCHANPVPSHPQKGTRVKPQDRGLQQGKNRSHKPSFSHNEIWGPQTSIGACLHGAALCQMTGTDMTLTPKTQKTPETLEPTGLPYTVGTENGQRTHGRKPEDHDTKIKVIENPKVTREIVKVTTQEEIPRAHSTGGKVTGVNTKVFTSFRKKCMKSQIQKNPRSQERKLQGHRKNPEGQVLEGSRS